MFRPLTPIVRRLLILNGLAFLVSTQLQLTDYLALYYVGSDYFFATQFVSYMFLHAGWWHLLSNMLGLIIFGGLLERFWGTRRFLSFYLITGIGAGLIYASVQFFQMNSMERRVRSYTEHPTPQGFNQLLLDYAPTLRNQLLQQGFIDAYDEAPKSAELITLTKEYLYHIVEKRANVPMVGASGAIFGILMAFGLLFPNTELLLLFPPIPIKAKYLVFFYGAYELWQEISNRNDNVAHIAHLAGLVIGFVVVKYWQQKSNRFY